MAKRLGLEPILLETDWRRLTRRHRGCAESRQGGRIRAVCVVHNETDRLRGPVPLSGAMTGPDIRRCYRHHLIAGFDRLPVDEWGVDTVAGSQG
jgi:aspartate aminotransferase-like enzyme